MKKIVKKPRILIVDESDALTDMWRMLPGNAERFEIGMEMNARSAMETARTFRPDLIFMDMDVADRISGEMALELDADPALFTTPVVFLTEPGRDDVADAQKPARYMVLTKPVTLAGILACADWFFRLPEQAAA